MMMTHNNNNIIMSLATAAVVVVVVLLLFVVVTIEEEVYAQFSRPQEQQQEEEYYNVTEEVLAELAASNITTFTPTLPPTIAKEEQFKIAFPNIRDLPQNTTFWVTVHQLRNESFQEGDQALDTFVEVYLRCHEEIDTETFTLGMEQCRAVYDQAKELYCGIQSYDAIKCDAISRLVDYYEDKVFQYFL
jgi:hypothetical protein